MKPSSRLSICDYNDGYLGLFETVVMQRISLSDLFTYVYFPLLRKYSSLLQCRVSVHKGCVSA